MLIGKVRLWAAAAAVALSMAGAEALAANPHDVNDGESTGRWFIELDTPVNTFRARAAASGIDFQERYVYKRIWKGLSVQASADAVSLLGKLPGVVAVYPVLTVPRPEVQPAAPELLHALVMTGADVAQNEMGLTGAGVKVAVIDTGIDYHHPDLGGGFGPGFRVATGYDFVGDRYDAGGSGGALIPHPDNDPDDCGGHGTHVAGIIGASGNPATGGARGVAPGVTFGAYRVFGCDGSTDSDIMLAAMERAYDDGMHVLNMSIGAAFQTWPQYPTAVGADALVAAGMIVVTSIGNSGANGLYSASAPGVGRNVIGVASFDNSHVALRVFKISPDDKLIGYTSAAAAGPTPTSGSFPMARTGTPTTSNDACTGQTLGDLSGKVALIRRGSCGFYEKARRAQLAGAAGVVLYNNTAGRFNPTVAVAAGADGQPVTIPVVAISDTEGILIDGRIAAGSVTMTWTPDTASFPNATAGLASSFTSYGLTAELGLKPDIGAPGGLIRSTWPLEAGGYATISGTSMASPHVAGAAALFLEAHPGASPATVRTALQNNATPAKAISNPSFPEFVHRQGAGMVDIPSAITATASITPSKLSLGEGTATTPKAVQLTIENRGSAAVTYTLSHMAARSTTNNTFAPAAVTNPASVVFGAPSITVPAGGSATVNATITPPTSQGRVYGGYLVATPPGSNAQPLLVPYAGFSGDYQLVQVLAPGGCALSSFPGIFKRGGETACTAPTPPAVPAKLDIAVTRQGEGAVFNVEERTDRPVILYHRAHQSRRLEIRALEVATNESHLVAFSDYVGRNATNGISFQQGGFSTYTWDGKRIFTNAAGRMHRRELPSGAYKLQLVVTKALAEENNPAHVETWTSPTIYITRP